MGKWCWKLAVLFALSTQPIMAQTLIPATSEDIHEFDRRVSEQMRSDKGARPSKFGASVSEEAKKLKDSGGDKDKRKEFRKWVSRERKKSDAGRPSAGSGSSGPSHERPDKGSPHSNGGGKGKKK